MYILVRIIALGLRRSFTDVWSLVKKKARALLTVIWKYFHDFLTFKDGEYICEM